MWNVLIQINKKLVIAIPVMMAAGFVFGLAGEASLVKQLKLLIMPLTFLMVTTYDINKIKFATGEATFKRAVGIYESGKVTEIDQLGGYYSAFVLGAKPYRVSLSTFNYKQDNCRG